MGTYFGTDGFRGEANGTLTADHAFRLGRFLGWYLTRLRQERKLEGPARVLIGKDTRRSCYMLEYSLVGGLTASGADACLLHVTTTPSVAYVCRTEGFDCGIMISASHNPYWDNGIKLFSRAGEKMDEATIALVEAWLDGEVEAFGEIRRELPLARGERIGRTVDYVAGRNRYMGYLISLGLYSFKGMKVGLDCANGAAWNMAKCVFDALGATTRVIHNTPDGCNINRGCGSTQLESLRKLVREQGLDVGFAYDGDADRCLCVDERGEVVTGDHILYLCGKYMKDRGELLSNALVTTVMSNLGLKRALEDLGIGCIQTPVGDKYVYDAMQARGCRLGGEESGHIIFSRHGTTGDGILTSLKVMEVMCAGKKTLGQLCGELKLYPRWTENVKVSDKDRTMSHPAVRAAAAEAEKLLGDRGKLLLRPSGTEPVVRVMTQAESGELCEQAGKLVARALWENCH